MSNVGIYGGSFDPVHLGHIKTASYLVSSGILDKIIFIPAFISPHKLDVNYTPAIHRLKMLQIAVQNNPAFEVSDYELNRPSPSYSIDTVKHLLKTYSNLHLIIGADNIEKFHTWKDVEELKKLVNILVLYRNTGSFKINKADYPFANFLNTPPFDISSTDVRFKLKNGLNVSGLISDDIINYIKTHNLYK